MLRRCAAFEDEDKRTLRRKSAGAGPQVAPASVGQTIATSGRPLDAGSRAFFEPRFSHDLSGVRVHDDAEAAESARAVQARAYAVGNHIVFAAGQHAPGTASGNRLLAHELTHVLQQTRPAGGDGGSGLAVTRANQPMVSRDMGGNVNAWETMRSIQQTMSDMTQLEAQGMVAGAEQAEITAAIAEAQQSSLIASELLATEEQVLTANLTAQEQRLEIQEEEEEETEMEFEMQSVASESMSGGMGGVMVMPDFSSHAMSHALDQAAMAFVTAEAMKSAEGSPENIARQAKAAAAWAHVMQVMRETVERHRNAPASPPPSTAAPSRPTDSRPPNRQRSKTQRPTKTKTKTDTQTQTQHDIQPHTRTRPKPRSRRPDPDTEQEKGPCKAKATAKRGGNTCHDQFATSISGTNREWTVTSRDGENVDFDALAHGMQLFEIKTGYGFLLNNAPSNRLKQIATLTKFHEQSERQSLIAKSCGYSLTWYFNDKHVTELVDGMIEPKVQYAPFRCKDVE
jgi:Domain of unknown function (DUF4157)